MCARICSFVSVISPSHLCARHQSPPSAFYFYCRHPDFGTSPPMLRSFLDHAGYRISPDIRADLLTARAARKSAALVLSGQAQRSLKAQQRYQETFNGQPWKSRLRRLSVWFCSPRKSTEIPFGTSEASCKASQFVKRTHPCDWVLPTFPGSGVP